LDRKTLFKTTARRIKSVAIRKNDRILFPSNKRQESFGVFNLVKKY
jgi:hypothetical protein